MDDYGHTIKKGTAPRLEWTTGVAIPVGATTRLRVGQEGWEPVIEEAPEIVDAATGHVAHQFTTAETAIIGDYSVELVVTAGGHPVIYPNDSYGSLRIIDALA